MGLNDQKYENQFGHSQYIPQQMKWFAVKWYEIEQDIIHEGYQRHDHQIINMYLGIALSYQYDKKRHNRQVGRDVNEYIEI